MEINALLAMPNKLEKGAEHVEMLGATEHVTAIHAWQKKRNHFHVAPHNVHNVKQPHRAPCPVINQMKYITQSIHFRILATRPEVGTKFVDR